LVSLCILTLRFNGLRPIFSGRKAPQARTQQTSTPRLCWAIDVDRYIWNGTTLAFDRKPNQSSLVAAGCGNQPSRGNHNGGVLRLGQDGKLYIIFGDNGPTRFAAKT
jgi:glucose/arabinose dehydrogenase